MPEKNLLAGQLIKSVSTERRVALDFPSLVFENGEATDSVSIGMAVADGYYDNPYFYATSFKKHNPTDG